MSAPHVLLKLEIVVCRRISRWSAARWSACAEELCRLVTGKKFKPPRSQFRCSLRSFWLCILSRIWEGLVHKTKKQCCTNEVDA
jgi:hypothetical protein